MGGLVHVVKLAPWNGHVIGFPHNVQVAVRTIIKLTFGIEQDGKEEEIKSKPFKTSAEWAKESDWKILDPDGWDRKNYQYSFFEEKIPYDEFMYRLVGSTVIKDDFNKAIVKAILKAINRRVLIKKN